MSRAYVVPASEEPECIWLFESNTPGPFTLASNCECEVWLDGKFAGDSGHRCIEGEALADSFPAANHVVVKVRWIDPQRTECLHRALFSNSFVAFSSGEWTMSRDASSSFRAKYSAQLPRQIVAKNVATGLVPGLHSAPDAKWIASPLPRARFVDVTPRLTSSQKNDGGEWKPDEASDIGAYCRATEPPAIETYDLGSIALHRFEVETSSSSCALVYSEVPRFADVWATSSRSKVSLADAVAPKTRAALFGTRGCRYVHVLSASPVALRVQRREYPLRWRDVDGEPGFEDIVAACRANLVACVDGGIVDTCWRERAQWTGDLRMSAIAMRALCDNPEVTSLALHQIAQSIDRGRAMVKGAWPIHNQTHEMFIPTFHLAFMHALLDHGLTPRRTLPAFGGVESFGAKYVRDGLVQAVRGWQFTDWDPEDKRHEGKEVPEAPHIVVNAWFVDLCARLDREPHVHRDAFEKAFKRERGYGLFAGDDRSSLHASAVAATCGMGDSDHALEHLDAERSSIPRRVTPYFAYFVAKAYETRSRDAMLDFVREYYGPIARKHGTIVERTNDDYSLAHGWSVAVASLLVR